MSQVPLSWQAFTSLRTWGPSVFPDGNNSTCGKDKNDRGLQVGNSVFWNSEIIRYGEHHNYHLHHHHHHHHQHHSHPGTPGQQRGSSFVLNISTTVQWPWISDKDSRHTNARSKSCGRSNKRLRAGIRSWHCPELLLPSHRYSRDRWPGIGDASFPRDACCL